MPDPAYRQHALDRLIGALQADERMVGAVLVGSGAIGFQDDESDIDVVAVVGPAHDTGAVYEQWPRIIAREFPVLHTFQSPFSIRNRLHGFLLDAFLELDLSFIDLAELRATHDRWRVLFDRTGSVQERMAASHLPRTDVETEYRWAFDAACFRVIHCHKALRRGQIWEAASLLDELRGLVFKLACLERFGVANAERLIDQLPAALFHETSRTIVSPERQAVADALRRATRAMLAQAHALDRRLGLDRAERAARWLPHYVDPA